MYAYGTQAEDVFCPGAFPEYTYISRKYAISNLPYELRLMQAIKASGFLTSMQHCQVVSLIFYTKKNRASLESQLFYNCLTRLYVIYTFYNIYLFFTHQVNFTALFNIKLTNWRKRYIFKFIISRVV